MSLFKSKFLVVYSDVYVYYYYYYVQGLLVKHCELLMPVGTPWLSEVKKKGFAALKDEVAAVMKLNIAMVMMVVGIL